MCKQSFSSRPSSPIQCPSLVVLQCLLASLTAQAALLTRTDKCSTTTLIAVKQPVAFAILANRSLTRLICAELSTSASLRREQRMPRGTECRFSTRSSELVSMERSALWRSTTLPMLSILSSPHGRIGCTNRLEISPQLVAQRKECITLTEPLRLKSLKR